MGYQACKFGVVTSSGIDFMHFEIQWLSLPLQATDMSDKVLFMNYARGDF